MNLSDATLRSCRKVCELCDGEQIGSFVAVDYVLFAAVLAISALIGIFYMVKEAIAAKKATADDVLMGGRDIGIFPIAMSLMASFMSAITVLGTPTEMYNNNTSYWIAGLAMIPTVIVTNHVFLPFFHNLNLTSAYEQEQFDIIENIINRCHVFSILPTGFGKSLTYAFPPLLLDQLEPEKSPHIALVVTPLRSLMTDQVNTWTEKGVKCAALGQANENDSTKKTDIWHGQYSILFTSPEAILTDAGREMLLTPQYKERLCLLAFDEAHCIIEWGDDFRPVYKEVSLLRSLASTCPVLALTATCTQQMMNEIISQLLLSKQAVETVAVLPDRPNLFLNVEKSNSFEKALKWYVSELIAHGQNAPKAIIYCRSMTHAADIYAHILHTVGNSAWLTPDRRDPGKRIVDMYHRSSPAVDQHRITSEFPKQNSTIRCVVATIAFGMGVQIPDVRYVFHWGPSKSSLSYWQEIGRCCRDWAQGYCYLFLTPHSLHPQRVDDDMIKLCRDDQKCFRVSILEHLTVAGMDMSAMLELKNRSSCDKNCKACKCSMCLCCSRCKNKCKCANNSL